MTPPQSWGPGVQCTAVGALPGHIPALGTRCSRNRAAGLGAPAPLSSLGPAGLLTRTARPPWGRGKQPPGASALQQPSGAAPADHLVPWQAAG